jgi:MFS family permease
LPRSVAAVLAALRFSDPAPELLGKLSDADWNIVLDFTDRAGLTLVLGACCRKWLPDPVRDRIDRNLAGNTERLARLRVALAEIAENLETRGIEYLLLKGFSQESGYTADPRLRMSYDLDLFVPAPSVEDARAAISELKYDAIQGTEQFPTDHLPPMVRKTGWQFRGDFFDPDIPPCIDLHFRFWDSKTECLDAPGIGSFWERRLIEGRFSVLDPADRLAYCALHLLRHLLRGSVRAYNVYEIAYFLDTHSENDSFWHRWRALHPEPLRKLEAVSFRLAAEWFQPRLAPIIQEQIETLANDIPLWFERYAASPVEALFKPNKHELWLHFALLETARDKRRVFFRRMLPPTLPGPVDGVFLPEEKITWRMRWRFRVRYASHVARRIAHHARTVPVTLAHGIAWKLRSSRLEGPFWRFLGASSLYSFGLFLFYLLYNLYLMDRGYREDALGVIASAFTAGSVAGVLPAASVVHRLGLKPTLVFCCLATAAVFAMRALFDGIPALAVSAFAGGALFSIWAVCVSPVVASLTSERARAAGFSVIFGAGIGLGIAAGLIGGRLPSWIISAGIVSGAAASKQIALLAASGFALLALWPLAKLRLEAPRAREIRSYPMNPFIARFFLAIALWSFATGAFNPFFNAYFSRQFSLPVETIGLVFSLSQALQVAAVLLAPIVLRKLGLVRGVAAMQAATAVMLAAVAVSPAAVMAAVLYAGYSSFQYMSEPGIYTLLMNRVPPEQHSGASALNFLAVFGAQALAASVAGAVVSRFGYGAMLAGASAMAACAGMAFWWLLEKPRVVSEQAQSPARDG